MIENIAKMSKASQDKHELSVMLQLLRTISPKRILEIGVHKGGFIETLRTAFPEAHVVGVDLDFSHLEFTDFDALLGDSHLPSMRQAVYDLFKGESIDFLFIDGDHTYEGAKADFELYSSLVRDGGIIGFHDIAREPGQFEGVEVMRLFEELKTSCASVQIWDGPLGVNGPGTGLLML